MGMPGLAPRNGAKGDGIAGWWLFGWAGGWDAADFILSRLWGEPFANEDDDDVFFNGDGDGDSKLADEYEFFNALLLDLLLELILLLLLLLFAMKEDGECGCGGSGGMPLDAAKAASAADNDKGFCWPLGNCELTIWADSPFRCDANDGIDAYGELAFALLLLLMLLLLLLLLLLFDLLLDDEHDLLSVNKLAIDHLFFWFRTEHLFIFLFS